MCVHVCVWVIGSIAAYRSLCVQGSHLTTAPTAIAIAVLRTYCLNALKASRYPRPKEMKTCNSDIFHAIHVVLCMRNKTSTTNNSRRESTGEEISKAVCEHWTVEQGQYMPCMYLVFNI